jgi:hypothetical protein
MLPPGEMPSMSPMAVGAEARDGDLLESHGRDRRRWRCSGSAGWERADGRIANGVWRDRGCRLRLIGEARRQRGSADRFLALAQIVAFAQLGWCRSETTISDKTVGLRDELHASGACGFRAGVLRSRGAASAASQAGPGEEALKAALDAARQHTGCGTTVRQGGPQGRASIAGADGQSRPPKGWCAGSRKTDWWEK